MKIRYLLFAIILMGMTSSNTAFSRAEPDPLKPIPTLDYIYVGITAGYNAVIHSANLKTFAYNDLCPTFSHGNASGFHAGVFYEQFLGEIGTAHSIIIRGLYNTYPTDFSEMGDRQLSMIKDQSKPEDDPDYITNVWTTTGHKNSIKYNATSIDLMYKFRFLNIADVGALIATVGPTFDIILTKTRTQTMFLTDPPNVQFIESALRPGQRYSADRRTLYAYDGDIEEASSLRIGMKAGLQVELNIPGFPVQLIPGVFYNYGLTDVNKQDWKVNAIQPSLDIRIPIGY